MKKIYCIEKWCIEAQDIHDKFNNNCEFWNCVEEPWKIGCWNFVEEYDDEEKFKNDILRKKISQAFRPLRWCRPQLLLLLEILE